MSGEKVGRCASSMTNGSRRCDHLLAAFDIRSRCAYVAGYHRLTSGHRLDQIAPAVRRQRGSGWSALWMVKPRAVGRCDNQGATAPDLSRCFRGSKNGIEHVIVIEIGRVDRPAKGRARTRHLPRAASIVRALADNALRAVPECSRLCGTMSSGRVDRRQAVQRRGIGGPKARERCLSRGQD